MADLILNNALGRIRTFAELAGSNDAIVVVPLEASGLEADATLRDYDDLASLLAGSSNEQTTLGRKSLTSALTVTVDDTNNRVDIDAPDQVWTATAGNAVGALLWCYDSDTTGGGDASIVPMSKHDFSFTPDGTDVTAVVAAAGLMRSSG
ncbi:hypothetical protein Aph01nite_43720 [Acrocarpospora phusangensis]|uniref:Uncharacterized protein n=1 Tax=Acrocarpospora phusangensis TaxID=1070424 RepID=A0A919QBV6_9ACTN|nr:hypothetical protein [Acrocarpospora phusangensis]GIH26062.1 hypothetical protein Aph01nite_43720 [Acrocarpospora phusangensis]